jgi:hypothetical protein
MNDISGMYFSRAMCFDHLGDGIVVVDKNAPRMITMDPWPQLVFRMADGQHTVDELRAHLAGQYEEGVPPGLFDQIISVVQNLEREGLIQLNDKPVKLPFYLAQPMSQQNAEEARQAMERDGYGKEGR